MLKNFLFHMIPYLVIIVVSIVWDFSWMEEIRILVAVGIMDLYTYFTAGRLRRRQNREVLVWWSKQNKN